MTFRFFALIAIMLAATTTAAPLKLVQLRSVLYKDQYVTVYWPDGAVRVDSVAYTHASTFELHELTRDQRLEMTEKLQETRQHDLQTQQTQWQLRALKNNMYLTAEGGGGGDCVVDRSFASGWETFDAVFLENGKQVQLRTFSGNWLGVETGAKSDNDFSLVATAEIAGQAETFEIVEIPQQRGVNLGSWFVPEKWMFSGSSSALWTNTSSSVVDLYTLCVELGEEEASLRMNAHWQSWITEKDFASMAQNGVNHVRIPMGYWDILPENSYPYISGGAAYIDQAINWAQRYDITVLIDLHGAPGSQNGQDHSGQSGEAHWDEPENVAWTVQILGMMAERWANVANVWGFELLNEPGYWISHDLLTTFYRDAYDIIRTHSADTHVVINSLYGPHDWTASVLPEPQYRNAVLDLHLYAAFSALSGPDELYAVGTAFGDEIRALTPYYPIIVGEMSLASSLSADVYTEQVRAGFAESEFGSFEENALGFYFWSQKLEYYSVDWALQDGYPYVKQYYDVPSRQ